MATEEKDWFDEYAEAYVAEEVLGPKIKDVPKQFKDTWFGKSEIKKWELHGIDKDELKNFIRYQDLDDIYSKEYWNTDGMEEKGTFFVPEGTPNLYQLKNSEDLYMFDFGDRKVLFNVYEIRDVYKKKNVITLSGWDYNVIIDLDDKTIETVYTR